VKHTLENAIGSLSIPTPIICVDDERGCLTGNAALARRFVSKDLLEIGSLKLNILPAGSDFLQNTVAMAEVSQPIASAHKSQTPSFKVTRLPMRLKREGNSSRPGNGSSQAKIADSTGTRSDRK
jgi:hypothetical protein